MSKHDQWRFVRAARSIHTETTAQKVILMLLASYANGHDGTCYPSYDLLMRDSGIASRTTVSDALQHLRDTLKILKWKKGWGNAHGRKSNVYQFDFEAMSRLADESPVDANESPVDKSRKSTSAGRKSTGLDAKVPALKNQIKAEEPAQNSAPGYPSDLENLTAEIRRGTPTSMEQSTMGGLSSPTHTVPPKPKRRTIEQLTMLAVTTETTVEALLASGKFELQQ
jgi:Helix-turn-helix domain